MEERTCRICGRTGLVGQDFYPSQRNACKACYNERVKRYRERLRTDDPEEWKRRQKRYSVKSKYGVDADWYEERLERQAGRCAICLRIAKLSVDHDHSTGAARGLICRPCNLGLGHFRDSAEALRAAAFYLQGGAHPSTSTYFPGSVAAEL